MKIRKITLFVLLLAIGTALCLTGCGDKATELDSAAEGIEQEYVDPNVDPYIVDPALSLIEGKGLDVSIPKNLMAKDGPLYNNDQLEYEGDSGNSKVVITSEKDEDGLVYGYGWSIILNNAEAGNEFTYSFSSDEEFSIVTSEEYTDGREKGCIYFIDKDNYDMNEISEAEAHDANGKPVESHYVIEGQTLKQIVTISDDVAFPITIE